jgi:hypothetical protein
MRSPGHLQCGTGAAILELFFRAERNTVRRVQCAKNVEGPHAAIGSCCGGNVARGRVAEAGSQSNRFSQFFRTLRLLSGARQRPDRRASDLAVTDPKTKRSVVVIINDRGPFGKHRVLDLSPSAARALGMISRGVIFVQAEVL